MVNRKRKMKAMEQPEENILSIEPSEQATPQRQSKRTKKREIQDSERTITLVKNKSKQKISTKMQHQLIFLK